MEKLEQLKKLLADADALAKELIDTKPHSESRHIVPVRSNIVAAQDHLTHHTKWAAGQAKENKK